MLRAEWQKEDERFRRQQQELSLLNKELNNEIMISNQDQKRKKKQDKDIEKLLDKDLIRRIIQKQQAIEKIQADQRKRSRQETKAYLLNFKNRSKELREYEKDLDKLIEEQDRKQWERRQKTWDKQEQARV